jgi:hypothetical protein
MGWLRLDDAFGDHPKVIGLSDRAFRAHVMGLLYCARHLTDGVVPRAAVPKTTAVHELERAGLWTATRGGGWLIHDFLDYNPSKADVLADREQWREQRVAAGKARAAHAQRTAGRFAPAGDQRSTSGPLASSLAASTSPDPAPTPTPKPKDLKASTTRKRDEIADALARAENAEPLEVPASHMRTLCVKANELRKVDPNVTPEEVARRAANWSSHMDDATISGTAIVKWWGRLGSVGNGHRPHDRALDIYRNAVEEASRGSLPG